MCLAAGARLVAYLEKKGWLGEMRQLRGKLWGMFKAVFPSIIARQSPWQPFELSLANIHKKTVSTALLECLVEASLDIFTKIRNYTVALQLFRWSQPTSSNSHRRNITKSWRWPSAFPNASPTAILGPPTSFSSSYRSFPLKFSSVFSRSVIYIWTLALSQLPNSTSLFISSDKERTFPCWSVSANNLWGTRMSPQWFSATTVATGHRLCEVKFAAGHQTFALALMESICYNLRDVYGPLHRLAVDCETLRASFHNTCGNHRAAKGIHIYLLEQIGEIKRSGGDFLHDHEHLS